jgi:hypothetical protein
MATLNLNDEQVLDLVRQLPDERRAWLFRQLLQNEWPAWTELAGYGLERARAVAAARGMNWDALTEAEREDLIDTLLHEPNQ